MRTVEECKFGAEGLVVAVGVGFKLKGLSKFQGFGTGVWD